MAAGRNSASKGRGSVFFLQKRTSTSEVAERDWAEVAERAGRMKTTAAMWVSSQEAARSSGASTRHCAEQSLSKREISCHVHVCFHPLDTEGRRRDVACGGPPAEHEVGLAKLSNSSRPCWDFISSPEYKNLQRFDENRRYLPLLISEITGDNSGI